MKAKVDAPIDRLFWFQDKLRLEEEEQGKLDNTVIIFMADNGYFFGEQRKSDKRLAYEESIRVPFAMRYPTILKYTQEDGLKQPEIDLI